MRQVPKYLVIGSGRMATHFCHYLRLLSIPFQQYSRKCNSLSQLHEFSSHCSHILLLINDSEIVNFLKSHKFLQEKICVHFSGQLVTLYAVSAHPLMTFSTDLYELAVYQKIPFILEEDGHSFAELFPHLPNRSFRIPRALKGYYHAMCVISGNFTVLLWQKFFCELQETFSLPQEIAYPYLEQITKNLLANSNAALTGPLARGDTKTIAANLQALEGDQFQKIYQAFLEVYTQDRSRCEFL